MKKIILFLILMEILGVIFTRDLVMVQVMHRHGARHTMHGNLLKNDPKRSEYMQNRAQLTEVGMRQLYLFGQKMRRDYITNIKLLDEQYNRHQIHVQSSNENRTLQSAQSFMIGLYPLGTGYSVPIMQRKDLVIPPFVYSSSDDDILQQKFENNTALPNAFYPSAIHSLGEHDYILNPSCPVLKQSKKSQAQENEKLIQIEMNKYAKQINQITQNKLQLAGSFVAANVTKVWDIVLCQRYNGIEYGITEEEYQLLMYLKSYTKLLSIFTPEYTNFIISPLVEYIFNYFDNKIQGKSDLNMVVESTHDSMIMSMLVALGLININCLQSDFEQGTTLCKKFPPFASNFIFELYKNDEKNYEIQIKYNGNYINICGNTISCNYNTFKQNLFKQVAPFREYQEKCGYTEDNGLPTTTTKHSQSSTILALIFVIIILVIAIIGLIAYIRRQKYKHVEAYQQFRNNNISL